MHGHTRPCLQPDWSCGSNNDRVLTRFRFGAWQQPGQRITYSVDWGINRRPEADSSLLVSRLIDVPLMSGRNEQAAVDFAAKEVIKEFHMTNLADRRSYNFGDTFGDPVETDSSPSHAAFEGRWCNQPDGIFEEDDAVRAQGGAA